MLLAENNNVLASTSGTVNLTAVDLNLLNLLNVVASLVLVNLMLRITHLQVLLSIRVLPSI